LSLHKRRWPFCRAEVCRIWRQASKCAMTNERVCAFNKLLPGSILDAKEYFDEYDDGLSRGSYSLLTFSNFVSANHFSSILCFVIRFSIEINLFRRYWNGTNKPLGTSQRYNTGQYLENTSNNTGTQRWLINYDPDEFKPDEIHVMTVDCVNYLIEEPCIQPSTKWFDPKSKLAGLKYEYSMPLTLKWVSNLLTCELDTPNEHLNSIL
jgi:hypothetical protein